MTQELRDEVERPDNYVARQFKQWREWSYTDDKLQHFVLSDIRCMLGEIERLRAEREKTLRDLGDQMALVAKLDLAVVPLTLRAEKAESSLAEREEEIGLLRRALEVFVPVFEPWMDDFTDDTYPGVTHRGTIGQIRRARALLASSDKGKAGGWLPIETAPRGQKVIAGWFNELGNWRTVTATFYAAGTLDAHESVEADEGGFAPEGWYEDSETQDPILPITPTRWRPLPAPPSEGA